jgi:TatA/E family protein of Tat protein translocase
MTLLFLNSLGTWEVILILAVVLMLFGSKSIPGLARNLGKGMKEIRNASNEIKRDIQSSALEMRKDLNIEDPLADVEGLDIDLEKPKSIEELDEDFASGQDQSDMEEDSANQEKDDNDDSDTKTFDINQGEAS